ERREAARKERTHVTIVISRDSVQLVRYEGEGDVVSPIKPAQGLENGPPEAGVARGVGRERRRKVRPLEVAGRCAQRRPRRVSDRVGIAITGASRAGAEVGLADASDRTPDVVVVFRLPDGD